MRDESVLRGKWSLALHRRPTSAKSGPDRGACAGLLAGLPYTITSLLCNTIQHYEKWQLNLIQKSLFNHVNGKQNDTILQYAKKKKKHF